MLQEARGEMLEFAIELARKIVGRVAECDPRAAQANLGKALELAVAGGGVTVLVSPAQLEMLQGHAAELVEVLRLRGRVNLRGDETVGRGGVRLLSRQGEIDATIRTQLDNVVEALCGEPPVGPRGGAGAPPRSTPRSSARMTGAAVEDNRRV
jgi:flagellar biosynthesis/type III secretory pathway protein FliH